MKNKGSAMAAKCRYKGIAYAVSLTLASFAINASATPATDHVTSKARRPTAIIGSDTNAIIGSDVQAIIGSDRQKSRRANAIIGSDVQAIIGSDRQKSRRADAIIGSDVQAIIGSDRLQSGGGIVVHGRIEKIDASTGRLTILGQNYKAAPNSAWLLELSDQLMSGQTLTGTVLGRPAHQGQSQASRLLVTQEPYVPGASEVIVSGRAAQVQANSGTFTVGDLVVDYTALLASQTIDVRAGDLVAVTGVQAAAGAPLQAASLEIAASSR